MLKEVSEKAEFNSLALHVTQSWEWGDFRTQTRNVKKVLRLGSFRKGKLSNIFQLFFHRVPYLSSYSIAYLPRSVMPNEEELKEIRQICKKGKAVFLKIEPALSPESYKLPGVGYNIGKSILPQHTIYINLNLTEERLLAQMHEKTRYNTHLAEKRGVIVKEEGSPEALERFITLLEKTESRQGFYSHYQEYYRKLWSALRPAKMVYLLSAYIPDRHDQPVASIMLFHFKDFLYYPYGGSDPDFRPYMAPNLLHWEAIKLGRRLGCKSYDLWGSYKYSPSEKDPWWGIYRFKSGFGGQEITFPDPIDVPLSPLYALYPLSDSLRWFFLKLKWR